MGKLKIMNNQYILIPISVHEELPEESCFCNILIEGKIRPAYFTKMEKGHVFDHIKSGMSYRQESITHWYKEITKEEYKKKYDLITQQEFYNFSGEQLFELMTEGSYSSSGDEYFSEFHEIAGKRCEPGCKIPQKLFGFSHFISWAKQQFIEEFENFKQENYYE